MEENMETGFDEFFSGYEGEDGYQTDTEAVTEEPETEEAELDTTEQDEQEDEETPDGGETSEEENTQDADKDAAEDEPEPDKAIPEQKFVVKVNKEVREVSYEDAPAWIQKGMDYDRVKGQLENAQRNEQTLQTELDKHRPIVTALEQAAADSRMSVEELIDHVEISMLMGRGMTEKEARSELRALKAERAVKAAEEKNAPAKEEPAAEQEDRAHREVQEFMRDFPGVKLSDEQIEAMKPYVQNGMSMSSAYLMVENAKLQAANKQREAEAAAMAKNRKNRAKAPGSQRDSGGQKTRTAEDEFFAAFNK